MTENNKRVPRLNKEIRSNLTIRRDYCNYCNLYQNLDRVNTSEEMNECLLCYDGLRKGKDMEYILKKYRMEVI